MNVFQKFKASLRLAIAVRQADNAHLEKGDRYYVMPSTGLDGKLMIVDKKNFKLLKRKGYVNKLATVSRMNAECFYYTPYRGQTVGLSDEMIKQKKKQYFSWLNMNKKLKKAINRQSKGNAKEAK